MRRPLRNRASVITRARQPATVGQAATPYNRCGMLIALAPSLTLPFCQEEPCFITFLFHWDRRQQLWSDFDRTGTWSTEPPEPDADIHNSLEVGSLGISDGSGAVFPSMVFTASKALPDMTEPVEL